MKIDWDKVLDEFLEWNDSYGYDQMDFDKIRELVEKQTKGKIRVKKKEKRNS